MSAEAPAGRPDIAGPLDLAGQAAALRTAFRTRLVLISPPRTGSTAVARLLWQHAAVGYHCHEPFEAGYWAPDPGAGPQAAERILRNPMRVSDGERVPIADVPEGAGLLIKEMSFQLTREQFLKLAALATAPIVFVMREPALCVTSRLRIVRELSGAQSFPAFESGWPSLGEQVEQCKHHGIDYVLVDSADLRAQPAETALALVRRLGLPEQEGLHVWSPRPDLQLCLPEIGSLMGAVRAADDPFYRRVLSSDRVQASDEVDWAAQQARIEQAGLGEQVAQWRELHRELLADPHRVLALPAEEAVR